MNEQASERANDARAIEWANKEASKRTNQLYSATRKMFKLKTQVDSVDDYETSSATILIQQKILSI